MNQLDFMNKLDLGIRTLSYAERRDILADYEEHFARGKEQGMTEEAICASLGDPEAIANEYLGAEKDTTTSRPNGAYQSTTRYQTASYTKPTNDVPDWAKALIAVAVILLNLFVVLPFWLSIAGALIAVILVFAGLFIAGCAVMALIAAHFLFLFVGLALVSLGVLGVIGMCYLIKYFAVATVAYIKLNNRLIKEGRI